MLFPEDPKQRPQLWEALSNQLAHQSVIQIVNRGEGIVAFDESSRG